MIIEQNMIIEPVSLLNFPCKYFRIMHLSKIFAMTLH